MVSKLAVPLVIVLLAILTGCVTNSGSRDTPVLDTEITVNSETSTPPPNTALALLVLVTKADTATAADNPLQAIAYIERAIRIDEGRPDLWTQLAQLHIQINDPVQAEQLARKAVALAGNRLQYARAAWLTIADAKAISGDKEAAEKIRHNWQTYRG